MLGLILLAGLAWVVVKLIIRWRSMPELPDNLPYRAERKPLDFMATGLIRIGVFLEKFGISSPERILRKVTGFVDKKTYKAIDEGNYDPDVTSERATIEKVPVVVIKPKQKVEAANENEKLPIVVYFHGGGWVFGSTGTHMPFTAWIAKTTNVIVISVGYSLAPETPYDVVFDECINVTRRIIVDASIYGGDANRVMVAGDSSGGNLAGGVALELSKQLRGACLLSPVLQGATFELPSYNAYRHFFDIAEMYTAKRCGFKLTPGLQYAINKGLCVPKEVYAQWKRDYFDVDAVEGYVRPNNSAVRTPIPLKPVELTEHDKQAVEKIGKMISNPRMYPLIASDKMLQGLPPHFIQACEFDALYDDSFLYAHRLKKAGVDVTLNYLKDAAHVEPINSYMLPKPICEPARIGFEEIAKFINKNK